MADNEISAKLGLMLLAKGRKLPAFLASLSMMDRLASVKSIDSIRRLPEELYLTLIAWPERLPMTKATTELLDRLADEARKITTTWSLTEISADLRKVADTKEKWSKLSAAGRQKAALN